MCLSGLEGGSIAGCRTADYLFSEDATCADTMRWAWWKTVCTLIIQQISCELVFYKTPIGYNFSLFFQDIWEQRLSLEQGGGFSQLVSVCLWEAPECEVCVHRSLCAASILSTGRWERLPYNIWGGIWVIIQETIWELRLHTHYTMVYA